MARCRFSAWRFCVTFKLNARACHGAWSAHTAPLLKVFLGMDRAPVEDYFFAIVAPPFLVA